MGAKKQVLEFDPEATAWRSRYGEDGWLWCVKYTDRNNQPCESRLAKTARLAWRNAAAEIKRQGN